MKKIKNTTGKTIPAGVLITTDGKIAANEALCPMGRSDCAHWDNRGIGDGCHNLEACKQSA